MGNTDGFKLKNIGLQVIDGNSNITSDLYKLTLLRRRSIVHTGLKCLY